MKTPIGKERVGWRAPQQTGKTAALYLFAYIKSEDEEHLGVVPIEEMPILEDGGRSFLVRTRGAVGAGPLAKPFSMSFDLNPGNRYYVVRNDPMKVQRPNGVAIWRWEGAPTDTFRLADKEVATA